MAPDLTTSDCVAASCCCALISDCACSTWISATAFALITASSACMSATRSSALSWCSACLVWISASRSLCRTCRSTCSFVCKSAIAFSCLAFSSSSCAADFASSFSLSGSGLPPSSASWIAAWFDSSIILSKIDSTVSLPLNPARLHFIISKKKGLAPGSTSIIGPILWRKLAIAVRYSVRSCLS